MVDVIGALLNILPKILNLTMFKLSFKGLVGDQRRENSPDD